MAIAFLALAAAVAIRPVLVTAALGHGSGSLLSVSRSEWEAFNESVSGRLYDGVPILAPCYGVYNGEEQVQILDTERCNTIQENRRDHSFVSDRFGGYQELNWGGCQATGDSCAMKMTVPDLDTPATRPCLQGSVPWRYVDARSVEDVQRTLLFAKQKGMRLVVKNTGHDYLGRSSAPDSFALWTHHIQPPIELTKEFVPEKCSEAVGDVITFGAGQQFGGVYEFANAHGYRVVGGTSPSVGIAGGWTAGGGHSMLSNELGLGVDNVQQVKAVFPDGTYITVSRCQNQDIFYALRGGGGGTFGVVTEMSYSVHPKKPMQFARVSIAGVNENVVSEFFSVVVANADRWASEGWGGYIIPAAAGGTSTVSLGTTMLDLSEAQASMQPLIDLANRRGDSGALGNATVITADYHNILQAIIAREEDLIFPSSAWAFSSRLIPRESFADDQQRLSSALHNILTTAQEQNVAASSALLIYAFDGTTTDPTTVQQIWQTTHDLMNQLRDLTPGGGAYQNEADPFEPDPTNSFWGRENYARLLQIKREVDPTNLLTVHNGVGWDETDGRYSCYPDIKV
ncbi:hypothetical protein BDW62DRAFT_218097 [Aspergillus aurantiobrunneus]